MANVLDPQTLAQLHAGYLSTQKKPTANTPQKKGNILTNLLPAIGGGIGAVAGIPLDIFGGAGSIAGGAAGSALGEALKEKLLGQSLSPKQIAIQAAEGGATSAFQPLKLAKGASTAAKGFVSAGEDTAANAATKATTNDVGSTVADKIVTQGQQAQSRVAGTSAGKAGQAITTPQDSANFLNVLNREKIPIGNSNNTLQAVQNKLNQYGQQISDHMTATNTPLSSADTKTIAANYLNGLKTTDPAVLKQAGIVANDLEKNVTDTKSLWEFRKELDTRIPDAKLAAGDNNLTNKMAAVKGMRQYISGAMGDIPGASQYHDLSEIKPLVAGEAQRQNNPGGGLTGRIFSSGPAQKAEGIVGKGAEKIGKALGGRAPNAVDQAAEAALPQATEQAASAIPQAGTGVGSILQSQAPQDLTGALQEASNAAGQIGDQAAEGLPATSRAAQALNLLKNTATLPARAVAAPLAYPSKSALQVGKQVATRGVGNLLASSAQPNSNTPATQSPTDLASALLSAGDTSGTDSTASQSPYSIDDLQYDLQRDPANSSKYIAYYNSLDSIYNPPASSTNSIKPTSTQYGLAQSGVQSLQQLAQAIQSNPSVVAKNATPGQGLPLVGSLVSRATGDAGYHALADNILQAIIHLQTGATATKEETVAAKGQLPQPGDTQAVQQQKLQTLMSDFAPFLQTNQ